MKILSGATGTALKEAQNINKSLSALGDVIAARASKQVTAFFDKYLFSISIFDLQRLLQIVLS
jgi:hypothetical protein